MSGWDHTFFSRTELAENRVFVYGKVAYMGMYQVFKGGRYWAAGEKMYNLISSTGLSDCNYKVLIVLLKIIRKNGEEALQTDI